MLCVDGRRQLILILAEAPRALLGHAPAHHFIFNLVISVFIVERLRLLRLVTSLNFVENTFYRFFCLLVLSCR